MQFQYHNRSNDHFLDSVKKLLLMLCVMAALTRSFFPLVGIQNDQIAFKSIIIIICCDSISEFAGVGEFYTGFVKRRENIQKRL
jgi:hypothetical protein